MEFEKVKNIIEIIEKSKFIDFELDMKNSFYIKMSKNENNLQNSSKTQAISLETAYDNIQTNKEDITQIAKTISEPLTIIPEDNKETKGGNLVTSPIVGTFYAASSPDKPPYVKVGDKVKQGDVLCIVEAMKVMNEITSKFDGEIAEVLVKNEDMVEYNQPLFRII